MADRYTWQPYDLEPDASMVTIPEHLLTYQPDDWTDQVEPSIRHRDLRARELQRQAQDQWSQQHGIWRDRFEMWQLAQLNQRRQENA